MAWRKALSVLPLPVGATTSAFLPAAMRVPGALLRRRRAREGRLEPRARGRAEAVEGGHALQSCTGIRQQASSFGLAAPFGRGSSGAGPPNRACWRAVAASGRTSAHAVDMTAVMLDETATVIRELARAAEAFAQRAQEQEACRDRARPGTAVQHRHAHSATLWRLAESSLRARIIELEAPPAA